MTFPKQNQTRLLHSVRNDETLITPHQITQFHPVFHKLKVPFFQLKVDRESLTLSLSLSRYLLFKAPFKIGLFFTLFHLGYIICIIGTYLEQKNLKLRFFCTHFVQIINIYFNKRSLNPLLPVTKQTIFSYTKERLEDMHLQNRIIVIFL